MKSSLILLSLVCGSLQAAVQTASPALDTAPPASPAPPVPLGSSATYMVIDPKMRAQDYEQAFETLRKEKTTAKVFFQLQNGSTISNIIDMTLMANATLILFRFNSTQGIRFQLVKVEEIAAISYL